MKHLNGWNRRHCFSRWSPGFGFFIYPCYSRRTHYPTLEKPGSFFVFFFLSQTLTIHRTTGEGRGPSFIPIYHFHPLKNIQIFICNFACEVTITYFKSQRLYLPDCYSMRFTNHLIELLFDWLTDDAMFVCWLDELILGFCYSDLALETSGFELASIITLVLQANQLTKCASHPKPGSQNIAVCEKQG